MSHKLNKIAVSIAAFLLPALVSAENELKGTKTFFENVLEIIKILIPIAFGLAILFFFFGIAKYIWSIGTEKERGKQIMVWGVVAIFVMTSIWGIVSFLGGSFGLDSKATSPTIPSIKK